MMRRDAPQLATSLYWKTKKQTTVSHSSEAEYHAKGTLTSELVWIKALLYDLCIFHYQPMVAGDHRAVVPHEHRV